MIQGNLGIANRARSLFKPSSWLAKIDFINHLVLFNNVLITVLSEKSGGKTSFTNVLLNNLDQQIKPIFISATTSIEQNNFLATISEQLNLNFDSATNFSSIVAQVNDNKNQVLLIIDDAQYLPEQLIKDFLIVIKNQSNCSSRHSEWNKDSPELQHSAPFGDPSSQATQDDGAATNQNECGFFNICLVSDYSLVSTLNDLAANDFTNLVHTIELGYLNENETRTYVLQRAMAERLINKPLTDSQFKQFYQLTKGNIATINSSLDSFIFKCSNPVEKNGIALIKRTGIVFGAAAVLAAFSYIYFSYIDHSIEENTLNFDTSLPSISQALNEPSDSVIHEELLVSFIPTFNDSALIQLVQNVLPKKQILELSEDEQTNDTVALVDKVIVIPTVPKQDLNKVAGKAAHQIMKVPVHEKQKQHHITASLHPVLKKTIAKQIHSTGFTIQLIASHRKSDLDRFKRANKITSTTKIRYFNNEKGSWYILTVGEFNTRTEALKKASKLPSSLTKLNPWVRSVSGLRNIG